MAPGKPSTGIRRSLGERTTSATGVFSGANLRREAIAVLSFGGRVPNTDERLFSGVGEVDTWSQQKEAD